MRIGVDIRELQQGVRTGIGRLIEAFLAEAPGLRSDARLFLYADRTTRSDLEGSHSTFRVLPQPATLWFDQVALPRALSEDRVEVFLSPYYKAPFASPCPAVVTFHDVLFLRLGANRLRNALFKPWARLLAARAAAILTDSEHSRRDLAELLGLDPSVVQVIPLGVSDRFSPQSREVSREVTRRLGVPENYILSVTNFRPHKNDLLLVSAFAALAARERALGLVLAGRPAASIDRLRSSIQRLDLEGKVFLPGLIADADLPPLYAGARVFAFPSLYEGFGLPVLEAMASGVPVACSSASSLPEVAAEAALLIDPHDREAWQTALGQLLADEPLRRKLVEAGLARARRFTWRNSAASILAVLERAAGDRGIRERQ